MKYISLIIVLLLAASCTVEDKGNEENKNTKETIVEISNNDSDDKDWSDDEIDEETSKEVEKTLEELNKEIDFLGELDDMVETDESEIVKLDATYSNPKVEVDMKIEYKLDSDNKIETINVSATTYDLEKFNTEAQVLVWKTIDEAKDTYFSWSSLTSEAFKSALK